MLRGALALFTMLATTGVRCSTGLQLRSASRRAMITRGGKLSASSSSETVGGPLPQLAVFDMDMDFCQNDLKGRFRTHLAEKRTEMRSRGDEEPNN